MTDTNGDSGFVVIHRKIFEHPLLQDGERFRAWAWLIAQAAWKPRRIVVSSGRTVEVIELQRGQLSHARSFMAKAWGWSEKRVRTFLNRLEMDGMIDRQKGRLQTVITICNYSTYQDIPTREGQQTGRQTGQQWAGNGPQKEPLNHKKDITAFAKNPLGWPSDAFERWYAGYPKKKDPKDARRAFDRVQASGEISFDDLMTARDRYVAAMRGKDATFIKYPAVWLNKGSYFDEPARQTAEVIPMQPTRDASSFTADDWRPRIEMWKRGERWPSTQWGPAPNEPGCRVPPELLQERGAVA